MKKMRVYISNHVDAKVCFELFDEILLAMTTNLYSTRAILVATLRTTRCLLPPLNGKTEIGTNYFFRRF